MNAEQGTHYLVKDGDCLWMMARSAYGDQWKYSLIVSANPQLNTRPKVPVDGSPVIYPNDSLFIPREIDLPISDTFAGQQANDMAIIINNEPIAVIEAELLLTIDTGSDFLTCSVETGSLSQNHKNALKPYRYPDVKVYVGGVLRLSGRVYTVESSFTATGGKTKKLEIYSYTADLIDSHVLPPYAQNGVTLEQRAKTLCAPFGITPQFESGASERFGKIAAEKSEKRFDHLAKLAKMKKLLISCTPAGQPLFIRPGSNKKPIASLSEGDFKVLSWGAKFDGRERFSIYRIAGKSIKGSSTSATSADSSVPCCRIYCKTESSADSGSVDNFADWQRSKALADSMTMELSLDRWLDDSGKLWNVNRFATVISPSLDIPNGIDLLIKRVSFKYSTSGKTATLNVCPVECFTGDQIKNIWT